MTNTSKILIGFSLATLASAVIGITLALIQSNISKDITNISRDKNINNNIELLNKSVKYSQNNSQKNTEKFPNNSLETKLSSVTLKKINKALPPQLAIEDQKKFIQASKDFNEASILLEQARSQPDNKSAINMLNDAQTKLNQSNRLMKEVNLNSIYYEQAQNYLYTISFYRDSISQWKNYFSQLENYQAGGTYPTKSTLQNHNLIDITYNNRKSVMQKAKKKSVVLTFDDGPSPQYTEQILDILKKYNIKATFFVVGSQVQKHCNILQRIYSEGHEIGNHSYTHPWMGRISSEEQQNEISKTQGIIQSCISYQPRWFRSPYASQDESTLQIAHKAGLNTALWTIDTEDWRKSSTTKSIIQKALNYQKTNIILMHDGVEPNPHFKHPEASLNRNNTVQSLETIIQHFQKNGFQFLTISEVFSGD